jgi:hypothetical protein
LIQEVPTGEWEQFLERFGREHRAWLATVNVVDAHTSVQRSTAVPMKAASTSADLVKLEFLGERQPVCVRRPCIIRIQQTNLGLVQALEVETVHGQFVRLAFRATAMPEQLDGVARGELSVDPSPAADTATPAAATNSRGPHDS